MVNVGKGIGRTLVCLLDKNLHSVRKRSLGRLGIAHRQIDANVLDIADIEDKLVQHLLGIAMLVVTVQIELKRIAHTVREGAISVSGLIRRVVQPQDGIRAFVEAEAIARLLIQLDGNRGILADAAHGVYVIAAALHPARVHAHRILASQRITVLGREGEFKRIALTHRGVADELDGGGIILDRITRVIHVHVVRNRVDRNDFLVVQNDLLRIIHCDAGKLIGGGDDIVLLRVLVIGDRLNIVAVYTSIHILISVGRGTGTGRSKATQIDTSSSQPLIAIGIFKSYFDLSRLLIPRCQGVAEAVDDVLNGFEAVSDYLFFESHILSRLLALDGLLASRGLVGVGGGLLTLDRLASRLVGCDDGLGLHLDGETLGHSVGRDLVLARGLVGLELGLDAGRDLLHGADLEALGGCSGERQLLARRRVDILSFCGVFGIVVLDRRLVAQVERDGNGRVLCGRGGSYAVRTPPREVIFGFGRGGPTVLQGGQTVRNGRIVGRRRRCVVRLRRRSGLVRRRVRRCGIRGLRALIRRALRLRCLLACALSCNSDSGQAQRLGAEQEREQNGERRRAPPDPRSANRALCVLRIH